MIYLIGGPARCGKSTLARQVAAQKNIQLLSTDYLRPAMETVATGRDLKILQLRPRESDYSPENWLALLRKRDAIVWRGIKSTIENINKHDKDLIIEGNIWPDYAIEITSNFDTRVVFIVDTDVTIHTTRLLNLASLDTTGNNWMKSWDEGRLKKWALYNVARSHMITTLAKEYGFQVFDIADNGISVAQAKATKYLLT